MDHIIMQAIANGLNLRIHVVESSENFAEKTLVELLNVSFDSRSAYVGHIGEILYNTVCLSYAHHLYNNLI